MDAKNRRVFGSEMLSKEFQQDLIALLDCDLSRLGPLIARYAKDPAYDDHALLESIADLHPTAESGERLVRIAKFYSMKLLRDEIPQEYAAEVEEQATHLGLNQDKKKELLAFLGGIVQERDAARREGARQHALRLGSPRLKSVGAVCDLRTVFESAETDSEEDDSEPAAGELFGMQPVILFEMVAEQNDNEENLVFQLTEIQARQLVRSLNRALSRCKEARRTFNARGVADLLLAGE